MKHLPQYVQRKIKADIEKSECPEHGQAPKVIFTSNGFNVSCCCNRHKSYISQAVEKSHCGAYSTGNHKIF